MNRLAGFGIITALLAGVPSIVIVESVQAQTVQDRKAEAERLSQQGIKLYQASHYQEAIQVFESALGIYRDIKDHKGEAASLVRLGATYRSLGQPQRTIEYYQQSLAVQKQIGDRTGEAISLISLGAAYKNLGQYQRAIEYLQQSLAVFKQSGASACTSRSKSADCLDARKGEAASIGHLAEAYNGLRQHQRAIEYLQQSLAIEKQIGDRNGEAAFLNDLGNAYKNFGQYQKAINLFQQSLAIYKQVGDLKGEAASLNNLGATYRNLGQYQKAIDFSLQSLAIRKQIGDRYGEATSLNELAAEYYNLGQYQKAIDYFQQTLAIYKQIGARASEATSLNNLGVAYVALGQYQKAIDYYQQSLVIQKQIGNPNGEAPSLTGLGAAYKYLGQYQKAIEYYQQSLTIYKQIGDRNSEATSLNNLGHVYDDLGQYQKAINFYQQSLAIQQQIGDRSGETTSLSNLGAAYNSLGQHQKAIDYYQQSLAIRKQIGDRNGEATPLNNLGSAYKSLGQYQKAIDFYQQSLVIKKQIGDRNGEATSLGNLGAAYDSLGQYQKAIDYFQQSLAIEKQIGDRSGEATSLNNLGVVFYKLNQPAISIVFLKQAINTYEAIRKDIKGLKKEEQQSYTARIANSYRDLADILIKQDRVMEALQILDLLKVQELEDYLKNIKGNDRSAQGVRLLAPEKALSDKLLTINSDNSKEINNQLTNQIQQLPKSEINKVPDYLNQIPQGNVLIYPLILSDRLEIILFAPNTLPIHRTVNIKKDDLEKLITEFRAGLQDSGFEDFREPSQQLYRLLIKPIETELINAKTTTILYAPDGILRYVPLAALNDGKQWLAEKYRISNLIAYSLSDFSPQPKTEPSILAGAFGGKDGERKFGQIALPASITEVKGISNLFPNSFALFENDFSRATTEAKFKNYNILHFATHAEFNTGAPDNSFIIFGNGDKIRLSELTDWQIPNVNLIVLSACQTGLSTLGSGVEILGFGYQVQKVGAKQAIASLWSVSDDGTQALMAAFYRELQKGDVTPIEALHRAQVALIKSEKFSHPSYWSAFFAIGNGL
ncbi:CHAT domain-containing protein [Pseudanabaena mucicola]|uniref:CHAT domain-containing protein n=1 Tax=Pseudanabaena mucicola TaxID=71190 RepID=UPI002575C147|nr:tetratricopeptide repeat protein [Pseudanabaena mucicola]